jgi:hypothetical protein
MRMMRKSQPLQKMLETQIEKHLKYHKEEQ